MPLLLLDLDNTLIDRTGAFRTWAARYLAGLGAPPADLDWLLELDGDGFTPRPEVARGLRERYGLVPPVEELVETLLHGHVGIMELGAAERDALAAATAAGWTPVVVTNGGTAQQERKLRRTGLDRLVAGWVVSEAAGVRKPDPEIFAAAARAVDGSLDGAWMIGDTAEADIAGAHAAGLDSVWLDRGRSWPGELAYAPTVIARSCAEAIRAALAGGA